MTIRQCAGRISVSKEDNSDEKNKHPQKVVTINWDLEDRDNMTLNMKDAKILTVHDNIFDEKNWERIQ